jgi:Flp pilus assembly protein TadG
MRQRLRRLFSDQGGTSIVELALVAPILAVLTVGMIDLSNGFSEKLRLEQVAQRAVEKVMNGRVSTADMTTMTAALKTEAADAAGVAAANVTTDFWLECNGTRSTSYSGCSPSSLPYARYVSISISKTYTPYFNYKFHNRATNTYTLTGAATVRIQ